MHGAEVETPSGSYQVFAAKKYVLTHVSSQISTRIARPIYQTSGGAWIRTPQPKQTCGWLKSLSHSRLRIFKCRLPVGCSLPKSASAEGRYSVNLRASVVKSKHAKEFHRSRTRHPLSSPAEEFLLDRK